MNAIILFAHGSRDPQWHRPIQSVAERIALRAPDTIVRCAYLELTEPDLQQVTHSLVSQGVTRLVVVPLFLGVGRHAREDLPRLIETIQQTYPKLDVKCQAAVGEQAVLLDLLADMALSAVN